MHLESPSEPEVPLSPDYEAIADAALSRNKAFHTGADGTTLSQEPSKSQLFATHFARLLFDRNVPPGAFRLVHYLKNHADANGCCWPGRRKMKRDLGGDFVSLQIWIEKLQQSGWLKVEKYQPEKHPFVRQRDPSKRDGFVYRLLNGDLKSPQPFGKPGTPTVGESRNRSSRKVGTATVPESRNETNTDKLNKEGTPPSKKREDESAIPEFSQLQTPLYPHWGIND